MTQRQRNRRRKSSTASRRRHRSRGQVSASFEPLEGRHLLAISDFVINELLADPAATAPDGDANGDGVRSGSQDEFIELVNTGPAIDIGGWTLLDSVGNGHTFPSPTSVAAGQAIVVFGGGTPVGSFGGAVVQTSSGGSLGYNNGGDTVTLDDLAGGTVSYTYGSEGGNNQSLTRDPDLAGVFVEHSTVASGVLFSPGFENDGTTPFSSNSGGGQPAASITISESGGTTAVTEGGATDSISIELGGTPTANVTVTVTPADGEIDLGTGAGVATTLTFTPANANAAQTVTVSATDDVTNEGAHTSSVSYTIASGDVAFAALSANTSTISIQDNDAPTPSSGIVINEIDPDQTNTDTAEFVELYDGGAGNTSLDGLVLVLFNGGDDASYDVADLDGFTTGADGFFVVDSSVFGGATNLIQNGADAVALFTGDATDFPNDTPVTTNNLVDAVVYGTNDSDDTGLLSGLGQSIQFDDTELESIARSPDGTGSFINLAPTPNASNGSVPIVPEINVADTNGSIAIGETIDLGSFVQGAAPTTLSFTIENLGAGDLVLGTLSLIAPVGDFTISQPAASTIASAGSEVFTVTFSPINVGTQSVTVTVPSDDADEGSYTFGLTAEVVATLAPEIEVFGNGTSIFDGATSVSVTDGTDFSGIDVTTGSATSTFTIQNTGSADLVVSDISLSGSGTSEFTLTGAPSTIAAGSSASFDVAFDPVATGTSSATVVVTSDDSDESTYEFAIEGTGITIATNVLINEVDSDTSDENNEFIELYDGGDGNTPLDGLVLVLFNGNGDVSYNAFDLDGFSTDANGFFVIGDGDVPGVGLVPSGFDTAGTSSPGSDLQNGEDGVGLYVGNASDFPNGTAATSAALLSAVVYETGSDANSGLANTLGTGGVIDEAANGDKDNDGISRAASGSYGAGPATPGVANVEPVIPLGRLSIQDAVLHESSPFGSVRVSLSPPQAGSVAVDVTATDGTATTADYELLTSSVVFLPGETLKSIPIQVLDDAISEGPESFVIELTNPSGATLDNGVAEVTIADDEPLSISIGDVTVSESAGTADFTVSLSAPAESVFSVDVTTSDGTASSPADYTSAATTVSFTFGETSKVVSVPIVDDDDAEPGETFEVTLSNFSGFGASIREGTAIGTIQASDNPVVTTVRINEFDSDTVDENNEFIELYDGGAGNTPLDGLVLVLFNGNGAVAYDAVELDGFSTDANGFFVVGDGDVAGVDLVPAGFDSVGVSSTEAGSDMQNGEDGIALFVGDAADYPNGTIATSTNLVDAVVYETGGDPDSTLPADLGTGIVVDEDELANKDAQSLSRVPDGSGAFVSANPTPNAPNDGETGPPELEPAPDPNPDPEPIPTVPEIDVIGNEVSIASGDNSPDAMDGTDFGTFFAGDTPLVRSFAISNTGDAALTITSVVLSGATDFALSPPSSLTVAAGADEQFEVTFTPTVVGTQTASIAIESDDADESTYTFDVSAIVETPDPIELAPISVWLNEFHYDNFSADVGEFIEVAGEAGVDLTGASLVLYNGSDGEAYDTIELTGVIDDEGDGLGALSFDAAGIQNGPDAIALVNTDGTVIEFVSYEGVVLAVDGAASGIESVDVGVSEPGEEGASLQRLQNASDGSWSGPLAASAGSLNVAPDSEPDPDPPVASVDSIEIDKFLWGINGSPALHHNLQAGDELRYAFEVTNTGTTPLSNVTVTDELPGLMLGSEVLSAYEAYSQPAVVPVNGVLGPYASVDRDMPSDPAEAKAWDNFTLSSGTLLNGLSWTGAYVEPFADGLVPETDFMIEIFREGGNAPSSVLHSFVVDGGSAGVNDRDVTTTVVPGVTAEDGGPVFQYVAKLPFTFLFSGDYWVSITALQTFPNAAPTIDPTWQWHLAGAGDGFYSYDAVFDDRDDGAPTAEAFNAGKDLAFTWHASRLSDFDGTLQSGQTVTFMGTYRVTPGDLEFGVIANTGTVSGEGQSGVVADSDEFIWATRAATISIRTLTNGEDSLPTVTVGSSVALTYEVTNTGNVELTDVAVTDYTNDVSASFVASTDDREDGILSPGETWQFVSEEQAGLGLQSNVAVANATSDLGEQASDQDLSYYVGAEEAIECIAKQHADLDGDGRVGFADFLQFNAAFGLQAEGQGPADFDCNGAVDFADFLVLSDQFGKTVDEIFATDNVFGATE